MNININPVAELVIGGILGTLGALFTAHSTGKITGAATSNEISGLLNSGDDMEDYNDGE